MHVVDKFSSLDYIEVSLNCWPNRQMVKHTQRIIWQTTSSLFAEMANHVWIAQENHMLQVDLKGSVGVWLKLASAKMAKVPTVVKTTKIQRNMRSTTMATYCQSSFRAS